MITVTHSYSVKDRRILLTVKGHAGQANLGQDIVCSAASILAYTVAQIVTAMESNGDFTKSPVVELADGNAIIDFTCKDDDTFAEAIRMTFFAQTGYRLLEANYPDYVKLITYEADKP